MSQRNVELTLLIIDAWNRRDVGAWIELWDPEGVWSPAFERLMEGSVFRGHRELRHALNRLAEFSEGSHAEFPEVRDLDDHVLALGAPGSVLPAASSSNRRSLC